MIRGADLAEARCAALDSLKGEARKKKKKRNLPKGLCWESTIGILQTSSTLLSPCFLASSLLFLSLVRVAPSSLFIYLEFCLVRLSRTTHPEKQLCTSTLMTSQPAPIPSPPGTPRIHPPTPTERLEGLGIDGLPLPRNSSFDLNALSPLDGRPSFLGYSSSPAASTPPNGSAVPVAARGSSGNPGPFNFQPMIASKSPPVPKPVHIPFLSLFFLLFLFLLFFLACDVVNYPNLSLHANNRTNGVDTDTNIHLFRTKYSWSPRPERPLLSRLVCQSLLGRS